MNTRMLSLTAAFVVLGITAVSGADKKIQAKDLPPAVQKAVQEETKGATIKGYAREVENGKTMYEAQVEKNGKKSEVAVDAAGKPVKS